MRSAIRRGKEFYAIWRIEMDWTKFLSREFLVAAAAVIIASVALFTDKAGFVEWAAAVGGFVALFSGTQTVQKIKTNGSQ